MPQTYFVAGASGTIGSAVARRLSSAGTVMGLHYCENVAAVERLQSELESRGAHCVLFQSTLDSDDACGRLAEDVFRRIGVPDGVALCAGRVPWRDWQALAATDWERALYEHCVAPFTLARTAALRMQAERGGAIVYLSSIAPKYGGSPQSLHYASAKGALETAMRGLSRLMASSGVRVNGVRAGFVDTPQQRAGRTAAQIEERIGKIPMGRAGRPEEIAAAVAFLLATDAAFVTGEILTVAGGD